MSFFNIIFAIFLYWPFKNQILTNLDKKKKLKYYKIQYNVTQYLKINIGKFSGENSLRFALEYEPIQIKIFYKQRKKKT